MRGGAGSGAPSSLGSDCVDGRDRDDDQENDGHRDGDLGCRKCGRRWEISALEAFQLRRCWRDLEVDIDTRGLQA